MAGIIPSSDDYSPDRFLRYKQEFFYTAPFYKLQQLCGPEASVFHDQTQDLFAFVESATNFFVYDMCVAVKELAENRMTVDDEALFNTYMTRVQEYSSESYRFYGLVGDLQRIAFLLETDPIRYKDLKTFREKEEIQSIIKSKKLAFEREAS
jgi:hypothetical protein